jgi:hypothetical protein
MPTNINTHQIVAGGLLTLTGRQIMSLRAAHEDEFPEGCFFYGLPENLEQATAYEFAPSWRGTGSGRTYDDLLIAKILPQTKGSVDIIYTWEGGEWFSGVRVRDGVVTRHRVEMCLGEPE